MFNKKLHFNTTDYFVPSALCFSGLIANFVKNGMYWGSKIRKAEKFTKFLIKIGPKAHIEGLS